MSRKISKKKKKQKALLNMILFMIFLFVVSVILLFTNKNRESYIVTDYREEYLELATPLAVSTGRRYGLFPSVILAQSALESSWGTSELSKEYNNYFGIKANKNELEQNMMTSEFVNGVEVRVKQPFREYNSMKESFKHYGQLISEADRYEKVRNASNYTEAAYAIKECGYATDPRYAEKIISIIESHELYELD